MWTAATKIIVWGAPLNVRDQVSHTPTLLGKDDTQSLLAIPVRIVYTMVGFAVENIEECHDLSNWNFR